jgi:predicted ATPase/DNA-binding winged helix-turn-helix (wHTH) protein
VNSSPANEAISIGEFRLLPSRRLLLKDDKTVKLGSRAFDLLLALADQAGKVIGQRELIARVWPNLFVEDVSLRVHMTALRKVLECDGTRYLTNVPGRGYCLVAPVSRSPVDVPEQARAVEPAYALPSSLARMVGRGDDVQAISSELLTRRFVSIVGAGGVGKTTVAVSVAHALLEEFLGAVCFVELGPVGSPQLLAATVTSAFRLRVQVQDPIPQLVTHLRGRRVLLVLDNCEHLIKEAAVVSERLLKEVPGLCILATSREALRAEGEHVRTLPPLLSPPEGETLTASEALSYSAAQLFFDRVTSAGFGNVLTNEDAQIIGQICRQLGGIPLAIELAAARVAAYGIRDTASLLTSQFALRWPGRRTAPARHQTLNATLDWSYNLLSETERAVLRRLSVFAGAFTLQAARQVAFEELDVVQAEEAIGDLLAKFLLAVDLSGPTARYRLLETTRAYAGRKREEAGESEAARRSHALYYSKLVRATAGTHADGEQSASALDLDDIRAALHWGFGDGGDPLTGVDIAAYSGSLWLGKGLLSECHAWMTRAAAACINTEGATTDQQLRILNGLAVAEQFTSGFTKETAASLARTLERAEARGDLSTQFSSYLVLWGGQMRSHLTADALKTAERCAALASGTRDSGTIAMGEWMLGHSKHSVARFEEARDHLLRYLDLDTEAARLAGVKATGYDRRADALTSLAHTLRILGQPDKSRLVGEQAIAAAESLGLPVAAVIARASVLTNTYLVEPDTDVVERDAVELLELCRLHSNHSDAGFALCIMGLCQAYRGEFDAGARLVTEGLRTLKKEGLEAFVRAHLCEAAIAAGRLSDALRWMPDLQKSDQNKEHWSSAELLRIRGTLAVAQGNPGEAEKSLLAALELSRRQSALFWELRSTMSLSRLWAAQHREGEALAVLETAYDRFCEGHGSADLLKAKRLIDELKEMSH